MKIAIVSTPFVPVPPPNYGGTELFVDDLSRGLTRRGHEVHVFATGDSAPEATLHPLIPQAAWPPSDAVETKFCGDVAQQLRNEPFDVIHANCPMLLDHTDLVDAAPVIYTLHHRHEPGISQRIDRIDRLTPVYISQRQQELDPCRHAGRVVYHGVELGHYRPNFKAGSAALYLGRFAREKGTHLALDAAHHLGIEIEVAGIAHPQELQYFEEEVAPRLARPGVKLLGQVGGEAKRSCLRSAAVLLFPIDWEEPFGLVMIEAMLSGTPVVAYARGSVGEVVDEGITGFTVPAGDFEGFCEAAQAATRLDRQTCYRHAAQRFNAERMVQDYEAVYSRARQHFLGFP